jgi:hypothetical protein
MPKGQTLLGFVRRRLSAAMVSVDRLAWQASVGRRLFVADRNSNKVTVYDSDGGKTLDIDVKVMAAPQRIMNGVLV